LESLKNITLRKQSHSSDCLEGPSHFLIPISLAIDGIIGGFGGRLGFQPKGLSVMPLYSEISLFPVQ